MSVYVFEAWWGIQGGGWSQGVVQVHPALRVLCSSSSTVSSWVAGGVMCFGSRVDSRVRLLGSEA